MKKLTFRQVRQIERVNFLAVRPTSPARSGMVLIPFTFLKRESPFFNVHKGRNRWIDFREGMGGGVIDFGIKYFSCFVNETTHKSLHE